MAGGHELFERRRALGLSQQDIADALEVERSTVGRWEGGKNSPALHLRPRLAKLLKITQSELAIMLARCTSNQPAAQRPDLAENDDMALYRRDLLRVFSLAAALLALPAHDLADLDDADDLDGYALLNSRLWQTFTLTSAKATMRAVVEEQLRVLTAQLSQSRGPSAHQRLCALAGDLFQLAGEIHFDASDYTTAAHCYALAAEASKAASAYDQWACALTRHAFISVYERNFANAEPMLDAAAGLARRGDSQLSTRYWVAAVQAETFAGQGNLAACQRALDRAEGVLALHGPVHNGGWLRFDGSRLAEERGTCFATLGRLDLAESALTDALQQNLSPRRRAGVLSDLAVIGARRRDPDQVLIHAAPVLQQARTTKSGVVSSKLRGLQPHLTPMLANTKIAQLNAGIDDLVGSSRNR
ncbi:helix-turn-helix transcriptional regulator [Kutzneria buriramensis]|uniref:DNA-binding XRE family transcriptional regulator n=1 Tax=Kutzneria buriramensis TaxID=1045776 RepID=A0A3E0HIP2_9PSEU|nr:helix-turn-helix transcriptional regulator [Kutzneria buriramensis]REH46313.1 DNA-binding XRE family transcriptional regulator [Kutzneria buriramensis]